MTAGSPAAFLLWAILACTFLIFMILHLWAYDRFNCLKWSSGRQPGAFKRVMTYSYLGTLPPLVVFSVVITIIKYKEGFIVVDGNQIIPRPISEWTASSQRWVLPLYFLLSAAWAFELVTHLEELTFWLFLLHQGPSKRVWFHSWEFRIWSLGSMIAIIGMPLVTLIKRHDLERCLAWIFLSGSSAGAATTVCFFYVIARFPGFIKRVKSEGAEPDVVVRLMSYYHLNAIRIFFRIFFNFPLLVIGVDGTEEPYPVLQHPFWADGLLMIGGMGCFLSSALTLLLFFPRSSSRESTQKAPPQTQSFGSHRPTSSLPRYHVRDPSPKFPASFEDTEPASFRAFRFPAESSQHSLRQPPPAHYPQDGSDYDISTPEFEVDYSQDGFDNPGEQSIGTDVPLRNAPQGKANTNVTIQTRPPSLRDDFPGSTQDFVHPYVMTFTSPIDLYDEDDLPRAI